MDRLASVADCKQNNNGKDNVIFSGDFRADRRLLPNRVAKYALADYASRYWVDHLRLSNYPEHPDEETTDFLTWFIAWDAYPEYVPNALYMCSRGVHFAAIVSRDVRHFFDLKNNTLYHKTNSRTF